MKNTNIVFILTDDQGFWSLGCYGNSEIRTPNLDKLAERGMMFRNFFCTSPVCSPARASILTGRIPGSHGIHDWLSGGDTTSVKEEPHGNGKTTEYLEDFTGYTDILHEAGYFCGLSGKWHMGNSHKAQKGFEFWKAHAKGGGPYFKAPCVDGQEVFYQEKYYTDVVTDDAIEFLDLAKQGDRPFYLSVHYTAPHSPWDRDNHPHETYDYYFNNCAFESAPWGLEKPAWAKQFNIPVETEEKRREFLSGYYAAIELLDAGIGRIVKHLEASGELNNTLICFTSDNGMNMGHHGIFGKGNATFPMNMFEESVKVPFLASMPGTVPQGIESKSMLSHYDLMPTLLEFVGLEPPQDDEKLPGHSFAPLLKGEDFAGQESVVIFDEYGPVRMIRTAAWKYVHRYVYGPHELYDLINDPGETTNLYGKEEHAMRVAKMSSQLEAWFVKYSDPERDGSRQPVTGLGQFAQIPFDGSRENAFNPRNLVQ
jgi:arylsulfatase A-like enzyme